MSSRLLKRSLVVLLLVGVVMSSRVFVRAGFTPFVASALPGRAIGDFDGDGRPDVAKIDSRGVGHDQIAVTLSGSRDTVTLDTAVAALIEGDVDHDGDLDLLATTGSGEVLIWVNDGHGQFTRRPQSPRRTISGPTAFQSHDAPSVVAATVPSPVLPARVHAWRAVVALSIRPPTASRFVSRTFDLLPPLRAPPVTALS